jgi:hypothetical protein
VRPKPSKNYFSSLLPKVKRLNEEIVVKKQYYFSKKKDAEASFSKS